MILVKMLFVMSMCTRFVSDQITKYTLVIVSEIKHISLHSIWKPIIYTILYNLFLIIYVGTGGRSISGKLPYWYAQYDKPIGWAFAVVSVVAVSIVHFISAIYIWPIPKESSKQYIV